MHWLSRSWRYEELHPERRASARGEGGGLLIALWHGRMLQAVPPHASDEIVVLVSGSRDGDIAALLLRDFRYEIIRGSTTRGGARALRQMIEALHRGALVVVTPDGPQGPRHSMNPGLAWMARATGFAVLPVGIVCDRAWHMNSWDRFDVPKPGARVVVSYGNPVQVPRELPSDGLAEATERIREELVNAERAGFAKLGREPDF